MSEEMRRLLVMDLQKWMQSRLELNVHKGDNWQECAPVWLLGRLQEEVNELCDAVFGRGRSNPALVWAEAADVANFAAMLADCVAPARAAEEER